MTQIYSSRSLQSNTSSMNKQPRSRSNSNSRNQSYNKLYNHHDPNNTSTSNNLTFCTKTTTSSSQNLNNSNLLHDFRERQKSSSDQHKTYNSKNQHQNTYNPHSVNLQNYNMSSNNNSKTSLHPLPKPKPLNLSPNTNPTSNLQTAQQPTHLSKKNNQSYTIGISNMTKNYSGISNTSNPLEMSDLNSSSNLNSPTGDHPHQISNSNLDLNNKQNLPSMQALNSILNYLNHHPVKNQSNNTNIHTNTQTQNTNTNSLNNSINNSNSYLKNTNYLQHKPDRLDHFMDRPYSNSTHQTSSNCNYQQTSNSNPNSHNSNALFDILKSNSASITYNKTRIANDFLNDPKLKGILNLHDKLINNKTTNSNLNRDTSYVSCNESIASNIVDCPDIDYLLQELEQSNVVFYQHTSHLINLLKAYQSITSQDFNLPNLNEFNRQMDLHMEEIQRMQQGDYGMVSPVQQHQSPQQEIVQQQQHQNIYDSPQFPNQHSQVPQQQQLQNQHPVYRQSTHSIHNDSIEQINTQEINQNLPTVESTQPIVEPDYPVSYENNKFQNNYNELVTGEQNTNAVPDIQENKHEFNTTKNVSHANLPPPAILIPQAHKQISLDKGPDEKLGITVKEENGNIVIGRVLKGEKADLSGLVYPGDIIVSINGKVLDQNTSKEEVIKLVSSTSGNLDIVINPQSENSNLDLPPKNSPIRQSQVPTKTELKDVLFLRSKINWNPSKDIGIPCNDSKMSFEIKIGDILEVLSQDEPNWWQARKVGSVFDTDFFTKPGRTGIIPSPALLESRVKTAASIQQQNTSMSPSSNNSSLNHPSQPTISNNNKENTNPDSNSKSHNNSLLKKFTSKKSSSKSTLCSSSKSKIENSPNPNSATKHIKFNPPYTPLMKIQNKDMTTKQQRRPISIIGPRGIGIMDLRSKLIDANPRLYDLPVPHTSRPPLINEVDGKDYNFVSKDEMTGLIKDGQMIEWGQYNDHYYGTSIDAVRASQYNSKVSLVAPMNLNQAINKLSSKRIQSYVVLITGENPENLDSHNNSKFRSENFSGGSKSSGNPGKINSGGDKEYSDFDENLFDNSEQYKKICKEGDLLYKKYNSIIDKVIILKEFNQALRELEQTSFNLLNMDQYFPRQWME